MVSLQNSITRTIGICLIAVMGLYASNSMAAGSGGGGGGIAPTQDRKALSPEQLSVKSFRVGVKFRDKALKQDVKAEKATSDKARNKATAKAQKLFTKAIKKQGEALQYDPQNYKAANELGYAYRRTGDYRKAIGAYNYALELNPNFHQATEYRAEAFLALGMLGLTQKSYMMLFRNDRTLAKQLMTSIDTWVESKGGELTEEETVFANWIEERKKIARMANDLSMAPAGSKPRAWPTL